MNKFCISWRVGTFEEVQGHALVHIQLKSKLSQTHRHILSSKVSVNRRGYANTLDSHYLATPHASIHFPELRIEGALLAGGLCVFLR